MFKDSHLISGIKPSQTARQFFDEQVAEHEIDLTNITITRVAKHPFGVLVTFTTYSNEKRAQWRDNFLHKNQGI